MPFKSKLVVEVPAKGDYIVTRPFKYTVPRGGDINVPAGFRTDFASIPRAFRWLVTGHGDTRRPAVIHDYMIRTGADRKEADEVFRVAMEENGVPSWKKTLCYVGVRFFSLFSKVK